MSSCPTWTPSAPASQRRPRTIVDDQQRPQLPAQRPRGAGDRYEPLVGQVLLAQLDDVDPPGDRAAQQVGQRAPVGGGSAHEVQAGGGQAGAPVGGEVVS